MSRGANTKTFAVTVDTSGLEDLMREFVDASNDAAQPAAFAGAKIIYQAVYQATPVSSKGHWFHGTSFKTTGQKYWFEANTLRDSLYHVLSKDHTGPGYATYHVSWNFKKAPYAYMVHNGTSKASATPFVTIGHERSKYAAQDAMASKYMELLTQRGVVK